MWARLPEAIAGTTGMKAGGWKNKNIILLWLFIAVVCAFSTVAGFTLFSSPSETWMAVIQSFAGGAILMVLANSMIHKLFENGGKLTGIFRIFGIFFSNNDNIGKYLRPEIKILRKKRELKKMKPSVRLLCVG